MNVINGQTEDFSRLDSMLQKYKVDYIIAENSNRILNEYLQTYKWEKVSESNQYALYKQK